MQIEYPRSLSMIYKELEKRTDEDISVHISYLEIYKETGFDLLSPGARTQSAVTPFPKVRTESTQLLHFKKWGYLNNLKLTDIPCLIVGISRYLKGLFGMAKTKCKEISLISLVHVLEFKWVTTIIKKLKSQMLVIQKGSWALYYFIYWCIPYF